MTVLGLWYDSSEVCPNLRSHIMSDLLPLLLKRGIAGSVCDRDLRLLAWFADHDVNRKVFGQPLSEVLSYYGADFRALLTLLEQPATPRRTDPAA